MNGPNDQRNGKDETPANPGDLTAAKSQRPAPDETDPATMPGSAEVAGEPLGEAPFTEEHEIGRDHAEPTNVTGTTNDNYIDREYVDVGGGD